MSNIITLFRTLKLYGMASCYAELRQQNTPDVAESFGFADTLLNQLLQAEFLDEARPLLVARHTDEQLAVGAGKNLVDRPGTAPGRHRRHLLAGRDDAGHMRGHEEGGALEESRRDTLALAGVIALAKGGLHGNHAEDGAENVDDRGAGPERSDHGPGAPARHLETGCKALPHAALVILHRSRI